MSLLKFDSFFSWAKLFLTHSGLAESKTNMIFYFPTENYISRKNYVIKITIWDY